jgi:hypothetical protein
MCNSVKKNVLPKDIKLYFTFECLFTGSGIVVIAVTAVVVVPIALYVGAEEDCTSVVWFTLMTIAAAVVDLTAIEDQELCAPAEVESAGFCSEALAASVKDASWDILPLSAAEVIAASSFVA